MSAITIICYPV